MFKLIFGLVIAGSVLASAIAFMLFLYIQVSSSSPSELPPENSSTEKPAEVVLSPPREINREAGETNSADKSDTLSISLQETSRTLENAPDLKVNRVVAPPTPPGQVESSSATTSAVSAPMEANEPGSGSDPQSPTPSEDTNRGNEEPLAPGLRGSAKDPGSERHTEAQKKLLSSTSENGNIKSYIRNASVTGIRLSGPDSKVVLNNKVYRLQEWVHDTGIKLKITGIEKSNIHFEDEQGTRYTKRF